MGQITTSQQVVRPLLEILLFGFAFLNVLFLSENNFWSDYLSNIATQHLHYRCGDFDIFNSVSLLGISEFFNFGIGYYRFFKFGIGYYLIDTVSVSVIIEFSVSVITEFFKFGIDFGISFRN